MCYLKFRLKPKRCGIFLALGLYVITFFYILNITTNLSRRGSKTTFPQDTYSLMKTAGLEPVEPPQQLSAQIMHSPQPSSQMMEEIQYDNQATNLTEQVKVMGGVAVLVLVCDRTSVTRTLDQLLKYRPDSTLFPIVLSLDCVDNNTNVGSLVWKKYGKKLTYLKHPNYESVRTTLELKVEDHMKGYYHIAAHYGWALNYTFDKLGFDNVIIVEDDLDISPDFFEYFQATLPLLYEDNSIWCVSAYNDNGKTELINLETPELLYRTDFFPGLGWMLTKEIWAELSGKWPEGFWDDWMRLPDQRKGRQCIHPEISRTKTFGKIGTSNGQFFDQYLKFIRLNRAFINFTSLDLTFLKREKYDSSFLKRVNDSIPVNSLTDLGKNISNNVQKSYRLNYNSDLHFKIIAGKVGMMDDFKAGVPRGGYKGIVPVMFRKNRLYLVPLKNN